MKYLLFCPLIVSQLLIAEEEEPLESSTIVSGRIELTVPPPSYTDSWGSKAEIAYYPPWRRAS
jgi:hypothetical protein